MKGCCVPHSQVPKTPPFPSILPYCCSQGSFCLHLLKQQDLVLAQLSHFILRKYRKPREWQKSGGVGAEVDVQDCFTGTKLDWM